MGSGGAHKQAEPPAARMRGCAERLRIERHKLVVRVKGGIAFRRRRGQLSFACGVARGKRGDLLRKRCGLY